MKLTEAVRLIDAHGLDLLRQPEAGIEVVAVGRRDGGALKTGKDDGYCITAFVKKKLSRLELDHQARPSFADSFASIAHESISNDDIDVIECGSAFEPYAGLSVPKIYRGRHGGSAPICDSQKWFASLRCGIGIANSNSGYPEHLSVGTAGFFMTDDSGGLFLVSNNHVIGRSNSARLGEVIVQPGTLDLTSRELRQFATQTDLEAALGIARLEAFVPLGFSTGANIPINRVDAALARLLPSRESRRSYQDVDRLTYAGGIAGLAEAFSGDVPDGSIRVFKVGRTTGFTEGEITNIRAISTVPYANGAAHFVDQIMIRSTHDNVGPFSRPGDSGSAILNERSELVGLLFAGTPDWTLANRAQNVVDELQRAANNSDLRVVFAGYLPRA
jgi:hypothetical protein